MQEGINAPFYNLEGNQPPEQSIKFDTLRTRGRHKSRESSSTRLQYKEQFKEELDKCGGLLHEDPIVRINKVIKSKGEGEGQQDESN